MVGLDALPATTPVLVIGGGPVGLVASALLSQCGIANVVVERRGEVARAPAAHVLRSRPMEILEGLGVAERIRRERPAHEIRYVTWCATLGGSEVGRLDLRASDDPTGAPGPEPWTNCPQNVLEPILLERAAREPSARVAYGVECCEVATSPDGVTAELRAGNGATRRIAAGWAIAADGAGSPTRQALGVPMVGPGPFGRFCMIHFEADLRPWIEDRPGALYWIMNPESPGTLIVHDPQRSHVFMMPMLGADEEETALADRLERALGVPARARILSVAHWSPHAQIAARYREGRVLLAGDAAHRFPPTGGLGLNTGILDVHNLVWKLALVVAGRADAALLESYERECRPAAETNAGESFENMKRLGEISRVVGTHADLASLMARLASLSDAEGRDLARALSMQRSHFVSEGRAPGAASDGDVPAGCWPARYDAFTLLAADPAPWRGQADALSSRFGVAVCLEAASPEAPLPPGATALLLRPDGLPLWQASAPGDDPAAALANLGLRRSPSRT